MKKLTLFTTFLIAAYIASAQWYPQTSGTAESLTSVCFTDTLHGWATGSNGIILHTNDGGDNWEEQISGTNNDLLSIFFTDSIHGWVGGSTNEWPNTQGSIYRTTDGGNIWEELYDEMSAVNGIYFIDTLNGFAATHGPIYYTTDGGETWETPREPSVMLFQHGYTSVCFPDSLNGWVTFWWINGSTGYVDSKILHTTDGGITWNCQYDIHSRSAPRLFSVYFADSLKGWAAGGFPSLWAIILKTTDGGNNWDTAYFDNPGTLYSVYFADAFNGLSVGNKGSIRYTSDGGFAWNVESSGTSNRLNGVYFTENGYGWAVGDSGTILHADYSQTVGLEKFEVQSLKSKVRSYPNPFSTSTTIGYELKQPENVSLSIYNHSGQLVFQTQENQSQGKQQLLWNAEGHTDGIYYFRLQAGEQIAAGKMVKVK